MNRKLPTEEKAPAFQAGTSHQCEAHLVFYLIDSSIEINYLRTFRPEWPISLQTICVPYQFMFLMRMHFQIYFLQRNISLFLLITENSVFWTVSYFLIISLSLNIWDGYQVLSILYDYREFCLLNCVIIFNHFLFVEHLRRLPSFHCYINSVAMNSHCIIFARKKDLFLEANP